MTIEQQIRLGDAFLLTLEAATHGPAARCTVHQEASRRGLTVNQLLAADYALLVRCSQPVVRLEPEDGRFAIADANNPEVMRSRNWWAFEDEALIFDTRAEAESEARRLGITHYTVTRLGD